MSYTNKFHVRIETEKNLSLDEKLELTFQINELLKDIEGIRKVRVTREVSNEELMNALK